MTQSPVGKALAVVATISLTAWACGSETLPTTPIVPAPLPSPSPAPSSYRLSGYVLDPGKVPIPGALVDVSVDNTVKRTKSDSSGFFEVDGLISLINFVDVTAEGYLPYRQWSVAASSPVTFELSRATLAAGTYSLTISAGADCRNALPEDLRTRTYRAAIQYEFDPWDVGPYVAVTVSGSAFRQDIRGIHDSFWGVPQGNRIFFVLLDYGPFINSAAALIEQLTPSTALVIAGSAEFPGTLDGVMYVVPTVASQDPDYLRPIATCRSRAHQFVLSR